MKSIHCALISASILVMISCGEVQNSELNSKATTSDGKFSVSCEKSQVGVEPYDLPIRVYSDLAKSQMNDATVVSDRCTIKVNKQGVGLRISKINYAGVSVQPGQSPELSISLASKSYSVRLPSEKFKDFSSSLDVADVILGCAGHPQSAQLSFSVKGSADLDELALSTEVMECK